MDDGPRSESGDSRIPVRGPAIGVLDSGVGGLSVWRETALRLPRLDTLYVADQAHVPYGSRPLEDVQRFAEGITRFLLREGAGVIVVACNTASAAALHRLRATFPETPFVGMEPAIKPAAEKTRTGVVGVIATPATFQGELFASLLERFASDVRVLTQVCPGLVEAVEEGAVETPRTEALVRACLEPLVASGIDELVLGCTHYPFLRPVIQRIAGPGVEVVDPAPAVARQVQRVVEHHALQAPEHQTARHIFYTTGDPAAFAARVRQLIGAQVHAKRLIWQAGRLGVVGRLRGQPSEA